LLWNQRLSFWLAVGKPRFFGARTRRREEDNDKSEDDEKGKEDYKYRSDALKLRLLEASISGLRVELIHLPGE
jgi:hypothetical protein